MQNLLLLVAIIVTCVSSFRFHGSSLSRSVVTPVSFRNSNFDIRIKRVLYIASETSENEVVAEVPKIEQVIDATSETKKVEEWRDPIAVAAEGKSPLADIFPGGIPIHCVLCSCTFNTCDTLILFSLTNRNQRWKYLGLLHLRLHRIPVLRLRAHYGHELRCYPTPIVTFLDRFGIDTTLVFPFIKFICK
jgi:hypothetical protein